MKSVFEKYLSNTPKYINQIQIFHLVVFQIQIQIFAYLNTNMYLTPALAGTPLGWRALKTPTSATPVSAVTWPRSRFNTSGPERAVIAVDPQLNSLGIDSCNAVGSIDSWQVTATLITWRQNGCHTFWNALFMKVICCILIAILLKFVPDGPIDNKAALIQVTAWHQTNNKPIPEPMLTTSHNTIWCH